MEKGKTSIFQLFRYADTVDTLLMLLGALGSIGDGMMYPLTMLVLGRTINTFGSASASFTGVDANKYILQLLLVALGVGMSAFLEGFCWTRTAETQTSEMRRKYLEAVLRQDVNFFDTNTSTTATYQVVSTTSSDVDTIHDVLSEKIPNFLSNVTAFFSIIIVAFTLSWRQTMVTLPFTLLFIVPGVVYGKLLMEVAKEMGEAYGIAGGTAEQAISSIRTVVSYVGESRTLERFKQALERTTALGIKQGFIKGVVAGSMGMVYAVWAFQAWFASVLVTKTGAEGGNVFVSAICVNLGGLSIMSALPNIKYFSEAMTAASRLFEMIDRLPPPDSINGGGTTIEELRGEIEFKNVIFTYPSRPDSTVLCGSRPNHWLGWW